MQMRMRGGRRRRKPETPWLLIATIVGIIVVVGAAFIYFSSYGGSSSGHSSSDKVVSPTTAAPVGAGSGATISPSPSSTIVFITTTPASIPATGVSVSVSYIGGFNGSYSTGGVITTITPNSGSQVYQVENATGTVTATFQKTDNTATHALTVSIYENGKQLATDSTSASYGKVTVTAPV
ncbi:MAG: hypothetical protein ACLPY4_06375 [Methanoregula sp.]